MRKSITVLPGDGVGPEVINQAIKVLDKIAKKFNHNFAYKYGLIGAIAIEKTGDPLPQETFKLCKDSDAILFGAIGDPKYDNDPKANIRPEQGLLKLRKSLHLYANLRPIKVYKELMEISPLKKEIIEGVDFIVLRELTGGIYFGKPRKRIDKGNTAIDTSIYSKNEVRQISRTAFKLAGSRKKKVTSVDKANVLETSRLWRETVNEVGNKYPDITLTHMYVDSAAMRLIKNPAQFDVILTENMFGDILTDEASVISGSIGLLPSASIGNNNALYEPIHGSYPRAAGKNIANPIGTILAASMMLEMSFQMHEESVAIQNAVNKMLKEGFRTNDLSGPEIPKRKILGTRETGDIICRFI